MRLVPESLRRMTRQISAERDDSPAHATLAPAVFSFSRPPAHLLTLCPSLAMEAPLRIFVVLLLVVKTSFAFVQVRAGLPQRPLSQLALTRSSGESCTPPWRYELDDLIKAASPWGSLVEAETIATDLGDFRTEDRDRQTGKRQTDRHKAKLKSISGRGVFSFCQLAPLMFSSTSPKPLWGNPSPPLRLPVSDIQCHGILSHVTSTVGPMYVCCPFG